MASRYEISTIFKMIDNFSGPMKSIAGSSSVMAKKVSADMQKTKMQIQAAGKAIKTMATVAVAAGVALAGKTVVDSIGTYIEFEDAITKAGTKFKDLDVTSETYGETLEELQTKAREVGAATKFSAVDAAGALDKMAMAGLTSEQAMGMLMGTTNLAASVGLDLTSAVDMATDAMGAFNLVVNDPSLTADEVAKQTSANMNRIADVVAKTTNMANTDMSMWFEAVKSGAPQFTALGGDIETFSASVGILANSGIKGGEAGTALRNIMLRLSAPAKAGADALDELGINVFDAQGQMLPFIEIMKQFETNLDGVADEKKAKLLSDIFGSRAIGSFQVLMSAGTDELGKFTGELYNAGGAAETMAGAQMKSFKGMVEQLKSAWQDKQLSLGKAFESGGAKEALAGLIAYIQKIDVTPIVGALAQIMQAIPGIVTGIVNFVQILWNLREVIISAAIAWGIYKAVLIAVNIAMLANPANLIIVGILALITVIVLLIRNWDTVKAAVLDFCSVAWENIQAFGLAVGDFFNGIWQGITDGIASMIESCGSFFSWVWDKVLSIAQGIEDTFMSIWGAIAGFVNMIKASVINIGKSVLTALIDPVISALDAMSGLPFVGDWIGDRRDDLRAFKDSITSTVESSLSLDAPVTTAPVTQGERTAYSVTENNNNTSTEVTVTLDKGLKGNVSGNAPNVTVQSVSSAAWK